MKRLLLIGGEHAHVYILKKLQKQKLPNVPADNTVEIAKHSIVTARTNHELKK